MNNSIASVLETKIFKELSLYVKGEAERPLYDWNKALLKLGNYIMNDIQEASYKRMVIVLPHRAYAAAFIALGAITRAFNPQNSAEKVLDKDEHLATLRCLKPNTLLELCQNNGKYREVTFVKFEDNFFHINPDKQKPDKIHKYPKAHADRLRLISEEKKSTPVQEDSAFLKALFGQEQSQEYSNHHQLIASIISNKKVFNQQIVERHLTYERQRGSLKELIRPLKRYNSDEGYSEGYVDVRAASRDSDEPSEAPLIIFDGSAAYFNHSYDNRRKNWIVLLSPEERHFPTVVEQLQSEYYRRNTTHDFDLINIKSFVSATSMEVMAYYAA